MTLCRDIVYSVIILFCLRFIRSTFSQQSLTPSEVNVQDSCLCDLTANACDVNCYCDPDCTQADRSTFDEPELTRINDDNACVRRDLILTDNSEYVSTENTNDDIFCLWRDNFDKRNFYRDVPRVENANQFDSFLNTFTSQVIAVEPDIAPTQYEPYRYDSAIFVVKEITDGSDTTFTIGEFQTLGPGIFSSQCKDSNQIRYLVNQPEKECESVTTVSSASCNATASFDIQSFVAGFKVVNTTDFFLQENLNLSNLAEVYNNDNDLITVRIRCITLIDENGAVLDECNETLTNASLFQPALDSSICSNVVTGLDYKFEYEGGSNLKQVLLEVTLTQFDVSSNASRSFNLKTTVSFTQDVTGTFAERSGNPGYIRGLPIPKGYLNSDDSSGTAVLTIQSLSDDRFLSVVTPSLEDCTSAIGNAKTPVGFGYNTISGCFVEVTRSDFESTETCQAIQDQITDALLSGSDFTQALGNDPLDRINDVNNPDNDQDRNLYFARFGNTDASRPGDWIGVFDESVPTASQSGFGCNLVTAVKLDILFANVGELESPQAKIIGAKYSFITHTVTFKCGPVCQSTRGASPTQRIQAQVIVNFIDVSETTEGAIKKIPPIETDIPYDFFYPFLLDSYPKLAFPKGILVCGILYHLFRMI